MIRIEKDQWNRSMIPEINSYVFGLTYFFTKDAKTIYQEINSLFNKCAGTVDIHMQNVVELLPHTL